MGIPGVWETVQSQVDPPETTLIKESEKYFAENGRPIRVAVDASILLWKFACALKKTAHFIGGMNHPAKDFMSHVCDHLAAGVRAVYVFDGPKRPLLKRGQIRPNPKPQQLYIPPQSASDRSRDIDVEQEFGHVTVLAKQLLDHMGIDSHDAPGEAEAECVALEKEGLVDAVVTTDGDALAFGAQCILRYRAAERKEKGEQRGANEKGAKEKMNDRMGRITAENLKEKGWTKGAWILLALLSGGDYSKGVSGCGVGTAKKIVAMATGPGKAKDGMPFAARILVDIMSSPKWYPAQYDGWRRSQLPRFVKQVAEIDQKVAANVASDFPNAKIVDLYLKPEVSSNNSVSSKDSLDLLKTMLWKQTPSVQKLRDYAGQMFLWKGQERAKQFLHRLTPGLLAQHLLISGDKDLDRSELIEEAKPKQMRGGNGERVHMIKLSYQPLKVAPIDYDSERIDPGFSWAHGEGNKKDPKQLYETELPEFLVRFGAPSALPDIGNATTKRKIPVVEDDHPERSSKKATPKPTVSSSTADRQGPTSSTQNGGFQRLGPPIVSNTPLNPSGKGKGRAIDESNTSMSSCHQRSASTSRTDSRQRGPPLSAISPNQNSASSSLECIDLTEDN